MNKNRTYQIIYHLVLVLFIFSQLWINIGAFIYTAVDDNQTLIELVNSEDKESESESEKDKKEKINELEAKRIATNSKYSFQVENLNQTEKLSSSLYQKIITPPPESYSDKVFG